MIPPRPDPSPDDVDSSSSGDYDDSSLGHAKLIANLQLGQGPLQLGRCKMASVGFCCFRPIDNNGSDAPVTVKSSNKCSALVMATPGA